MRLKNIATFVTLSLISSTALATVTTGYFVSKNKISSDADDSGSRSAPEVQVFIRSQKREGSSISTEYGYILKTTKDGFYGDIFKIEESEDGTQAWVRIYGIPKSIPGSTDPTIKTPAILGVNLDQEASFMGTSVTDKKGSSVLHLDPTSFGRRLKCDLSLKLKSEEWKKGNWLNPLPTESLTFKGVEGNIDYKAGTLVGKLVIGLEGDTGIFSAEQQLPGIAVVRGQTLSSESADGKAMNRNITAVAMMVKEEVSYLMGNTEHTRLHLLRYDETNPQNCFSRVAVLDQKK